MMGWLGPRGLASVVFLLLTIEAAREANADVSALAARTGWTIVLSVLLHGLTAGPLAAWYARRLQFADPASPELVEVSPPPHSRRTVPDGAHP
jgi:NhaP-type Na+/H+ or K+/H+ antiporter